MRYRLAVFDVDGTLKPRTGPISATVVDAVSRARYDGVRVTIATGRMYRSAEPFVRQLGLTDPVICYGGAVVTNPVTGQSILRRGIPVGLALEVAAVARRRGLGVLASFDDHMVYENVDPGSPFTAYANRTFAAPVADITYVLDTEPCHMALISPLDKTHDLVTDLASEFADRLFVTSGHPMLAEVYCLTANKGTALEHVADLLGIDRCEVLAAGDDLNDIPMLKWAGMGVAMDGAPEVVRNAADSLAPGAEMDGAAWIVNNLLLPANQPAAPPAAERILPR